MQKNLTLGLGILSLMVTNIGFAAQSHPAHKKHTLAVGDISGYYLANTAGLLDQTLTLRMVDKYRNRGFEQGNFVGRFGTSQIVGQAIILGNEDGLDDTIQFDFMYVEPQVETEYVHIETMHVHTETIMQHGLVTGITLTIGNSEIKFHRVTKAQYAVIDSLTNKTNK